MNNESVVRVFRLFYLAELELGSIRSRQDYCALFPGFESEVGEAFDRLQGDSSSDTATRSSPRGVESAGGDASSIGPYHLVREIGRGGQAVVWLGEDLELKRPVAVKILLRGGEISERQLRRFRREAEVCSRLNHPGICTIYGTGIERGVPYIAMQLIDGVTLTDFVKKTTNTQVTEDLEIDAETEAPSPTAATRKLPDRSEIEQLVLFVARAARALHVAHEAGIIHRDIKPGNIMVQKDSTPVLLDFGLAHQDDDSVASLTNTGEFFGTPAYMSPEQISAHRIGLDRRTDIFSLGVTLYECLTGLRPFDAGSHAATYQAIMVKEAPDPRTINKAVSADLWAVVHKSIEKDRDNRYATAADFADDLERVVALVPVKARRATPWLRLVRWTQRNRSVAGLSAALLVTVLGVAIYLLTSGVLDRRRLEEERQKKFTTAETLFVELSKEVFSSFTRPGATTELVSVIRELGPEGLDWVLEKSHSKDDNQRVLAAQALLSLSHPSTIDRLKEIAISDASAGPASWASQALMRMTTPGVVDALRETYTTTRHEPVKINALWGLVYNQDEAGLRDAAAFLDDPGGLRDYYDALGRGFLILGRNTKAVPLVDKYLKEYFAKTTDRTSIDFRQVLMMAAEFYKQQEPEIARDRLEQLAADKSLPEESRTRLAEAAAALPPANRP